MNKKNFTKQLICWSAVCVQNSLSVIVGFMYGNILLAMMLFLFSAPVYERMHEAAKEEK